MGLPLQAAAHLVTYDTHGRPGEIGDLRVESVIAAPASPMSRQSWALDGAALSRRQTLQDGPLRRNIDLGRLDCLHLPAPGRALGKPPVRVFLLGLRHRRNAGETCGCIRTCWHTELGRLPLRQSPRRRVSRHSSRTSHARGDQGSRQVATGLERETASEVGTPPPGSARGSTASPSSCTRGTRTSSCPRTP